MGYGGPVWHASVKNLPGKKVREKDLRRIALRHLAGVGDRSMEWSEWTGTAYHVRRRLTPQEQSIVGDAIDLRADAEQFRARLDRARPDMPAVMVGFAMREVEPHG